MKRTADPHIACSRKKPIPDEHFTSVSLRRGEIDEELASMKYELLVATLKLCWCRAGRALNLQAIVSSAAWQEQRPNFHYVGFCYKLCKAIAIELCPDQGPISLDLTGNSIHTLKCLVPQLRGHGITVAHLRLENNRLASLEELLLLKPLKLCSLVLTGNPLPLQYVAFTQRRLPTLTHVDDVDVREAQAQQQLTSQQWTRKRVVSDSSSDHHTQAQQLHHFVGKFLAAVDARRWQVLPQAYTLDACFSYQLHQDLNVRVYSSEAAKRHQKALNHHNHNMRRQHNRERALMHMQMGRQQVCEALQRLYGSGHTTHSLSSVRCDSHMIGNGVVCSLHGECTFEFPGDQRVAQHCYDRTLLLYPCLPEADGDWGFAIANDQLTLRDHAIPLIVLPAQPSIKAQLKGATKLKDEYVELLLEAAGHDLQRALVLFNTPPQPIPQDAFLP
eukprot:NODE_1571_length_1454_cov_41.246420_g1490_i0.p1 GENE.NODE_1571_length_1454_cov_41.246420_g1490_i0~~NODE_1571_length_1454_cov_41.246420_g1490_i0.p1  ORF type:complete len:445 (+),score=89.91 NODE_1571_length_1454_cov_41.246420_g1490_i0:38-1372(+)